MSCAPRWDCIQAARSYYTQNQWVTLESLKLENFFSFGGKIFSYNKKLAVWLVWFCVPFPTSLKKKHQNLSLIFKSFVKKKKKTKRLVFLEICSSNFYGRSQIRYASITAVFILSHRSLIKKLKVLYLSWKAAAKPTEFSYQRRISKYVSKTSFQCLKKLCFVS